jgi:hypothetical protein
MQVQKDQRFLIKLKQKEKYYYNIATDMLVNLLALLPLGLKEYLFIFMVLLIIHIVMFETANAIRGLFKLCLWYFELEGKYRIFRKNLNVLIYGRKRRVIKRDRMVYLLGRYLTFTLNQYKIIWPKRKYQGNYKIYSRRRYYDLVFPLQQNGKRLMTDLNQYLYPARGNGKNEYRQLIVFPRHRKINISILKRLKKYIRTQFWVVVRIMLMIILVIIEILLPARLMQWLFVDNNTNKSKKIKSNKK